jgi:hypothetical protein
MRMNCGWRGTLPGLAMVTELDCHQYLRAATVFTAAAAFFPFVCVCESFANA